MTAPVIDIGTLVARMHHLRIPAREINELCRLLCQSDQLLCWLADRHPLAVTDLEIACMVTFLRNQESIKHLPAEQLKGIAAELMADASEQKAWVN